MKYLLSAALISMLIVVGCSDTATDVQSSDQSIEAWAGGTDSHVPYTGPVRSHKTGETVMGKPLTVIEFNELPNQPVHGLNSNGVTYEFTVNGNPSNAARYRAGGPSPGPYVQPPVLEGPQSGRLCMTFDQPTQVVQFGVAINVGGVRDEAVTVEVYGPNNKLREIIDMDLAPAPFFAGGWFSYEKKPRIEDFLNEQISNPASIVENELDKYTHGIID